MIEDAHASDLWRKRFGVAHPSGGTGSLHAQAQLYDVAPVVGASSAYVDAMSIVLNALQAWRKDGRRMGHQNS
uniref:DUF7742 family protein n=1 Tax=Pseudooctadecabacter jejudonensis TaxID=1391910 RepID=UPI00117B6A9D|nr:hypothetical protein [Pseudooctadecabacter jejudonensis]